MCCHPLPSIHLFYLGVFLFALLEFEVLYFRSPEGVQLGRLTAINFCTVVDEGRFATNTHDAVIDFDSTCAQSCA